LALKLYNTLTRKKEDFIPLEDNKVRLYCCGPTVYNYAHIGNLRTYIFEDILRRALKADKYQLTHVMNVTDVGHLTGDEDAGEDKMQKGAEREGKSIWEIAKFYTEAFFTDTERLNIEKPDIVAPATEHIPAMIELVKKLEEKGFTYETDQAVYFHVPLFPDYTKLSRQNLEEKLVGVREEVQEDPQKKHPADFALWFKAVGRFQNHIMRWESPWGVGFPGWHIECSAMAMQYLGETIDIHCGGVDHITVHHTNEIAQSEAANGVQFVRYWVHGEFLVIDGGRMGKSEGNFITLQTLIDKGYDPLAYRALCLTAHYRSKLNLTWEGMDAAQSALNRLRDFVRLASKRNDEEQPWMKDYADKFWGYVRDDLDMPKAWATVQELVGECYKRDEYGSLEILEDFDRVLGLKLMESAKEEELPAELAALIDERLEARRSKNWARADEIRKQLLEAGIVLEDRPEGTIWKRA
jgi:cysteinyl-tRNA synthetase